MRKLILKCAFTLGDIVMLTAAVRDLHKCHPGEFQTDVRTVCPALWENNPHLTHLDEQEPGVEILDCVYPLINRSNKLPYHCLHGFVQFLNAKLGLKIGLTAFRGDIHISRREKGWFSQVQELTGQDTPFWIIAAGGKHDLTIKWWDSRRYQQVVDHFRGKIQFVQVGGFGDHHPPLRGVIDLRGKTDQRQLVRLVHHAQGVLCGVTGLMHLAAAVPARRGQPRNRACVVVAGGREPVHWEAYPFHQFIHNVGALPCSAAGGCWRSRTFALGDGDKGDRPEWLCVDTRGELPRCMDMITAEEVIARIETYFTGGALRYLTARQAQAARRGVARTRDSLCEDAPLNAGTAPRALTERIAQLRPYPEFPPPAHNHRHDVRDWAAPDASPRVHAAPGRRGTFAGRGIVICGGGARLFPSVWVCVNQLRRLGCALPIELWHLGPAEVDARMAAMLKPLGVRCVDAEEVRRRHPARILRGWELKPYALLHSSFRETLLLDADNVPVRDPEPLFDAPQFRATGAVFWPDVRDLPLPARIWKLCGVEPRVTREFESGQILVDKRKCWRALNLSLWFNEQSDFFYRHLHGDKDTFQMAFRRLGQPFAMPGHGVHRLPFTMCQHDFDGRRVFQHRNTDKWHLLPVNRCSKGFWFEEECLADLRALSGLWDGGLPAARVGGHNGTPPRARPAAPKLKMTACVVSCRHRGALRRETIRQLEAAGWTGPVIVQLEEHALGSQLRNMTEDTRMGLRRAQATDPDFVLMLEDDLEFNRHFWHNLISWPPLLRGEVTLASFYNPGHRVMAFDAPGHAVIVRAASIFGSQAFLLSRRCLDYALKNWDREKGPPDLRLPLLAERLGGPIYFHCPSLVQHVGRSSTWGGFFHQARDYDRHWKAQPAANGEASGSARRLPAAGRFAVAPSGRRNGPRFTNQLNPAQV